MDTNSKSRLDELTSPRRNHFFYGKLLDEFHLRMEQEYFNDKRWMLNRLGLGHGVLCGLQVQLKQGGTPLSKALSGQRDDSNPADLLEVQPGVAIDACGREIVVPETVYVDPTKIAGECGTVRDRTAEDGSDFYLALCYHECKADFVPALVTDCKPQEQCAPSTIVENYRLELRKGSPSSNWIDLREMSLLTALTAGKTFHEKKSRLSAVRSFSGPGDPYVVLAYIKVDGAKVVQMDSVGLPRVEIYSNDVLLDLLLALDEKWALWASTGSKGPAGPAGPAGPGLESDLTRIVATSWVHGDKYVVRPTSAIVAPVAVVGMLIDGIPQAEGAEAFVIAFNNPVKFPHDLRAFEWIHYPPFEVMACREGLPETNSWLSVNLPIVPMTRVEHSQGRITKATVEVQKIDGKIIWPTEAMGLAFILPTGFFNFINSMELAPGSIHIRLRCDFLVDVRNGKDGKAVNGEFVRAQFPTGDGQPGTGLGLQGGTFESWFWVYRLSAAPPAPKPAPALPVPVNEARVLELAMVPGIGVVAAEAIVEARNKKKTKRFRRLEELKGLGGIDDQRLALMRPYLKIE